MKIVITNNPIFGSLVKRDRVQGHEVEFHDTDYLGVLKIARDRVHLGHKLLTHPLSGSVKPGETPYKTLVLSAGPGPGTEASLDEKSLSIMEDSIQTCQKFMANGGERSWNKDVLEDFQLVDYDLIFSGL